MDFNKFVVLNNAKKFEIIFIDNFKNTIISSTLTFIVIFFFLFYKTIDNIDFSIYINHQQIALFEMSKDCTDI